MPSHSHATPRSHRRRAASRRAAALAQLLAALGLCTGIVTTFALLGPGFLYGANASRPAFDPVTPREPAHQQTLQALRMMVEHSAGLVAVHPQPAASPRVVLWYADANDDGMPGAGELVVIAHHPVAGTLVAHAFAADPEAPAHAGPPIDPRLVVTPGFAERWTFRPDVTGRVVASGITSFRLERWNGPPDDNGTPQAVLELNWSIAGDQPDIGRLLVPIADAPFAAEGSTP